MKKVSFNDLNFGDKFKYWGSYYVKIGHYIGVNINNGDSRFLRDTKVIPVKIKIVEVV